jgi:hypothetical protein
VLAVAALTMSAILPVKPDSLAAAVTIPGRKDR